MTAVNPPIAFNWTDLETTGLNARTCHILEIGSLPTDQNLNVMGRFESLVLPRCFDGTTESLGMDEYVTNMHTKNGLLDALREALEHPEEVREQLYIEKVSARYVEFLESCGLTADLPRWLEDGDDPNTQTKPYLAGSTVGFDKGFMEVHMEEALNCLHHRIYDVSTLKIAAEKYRPDVTWPKGAGAHRAIDDVLESIEHARILRDNMIAAVPAAT